MKLVCQKCEIEFLIYKNGVTVVEMFQKNKNIYKLWKADLWECPACGYKIVAGFAREPFAIHFKNNCEEIVRKLEKDGETIIYDYEGQYSNQ